MFLKAYYCDFNEVFNSTRTSYELFIDKSSFKIYTEPGIHARCYDFY